MSSVHREHLEEEFEGQAWWRRQKAAEYPGDDRNLKAAGIFDRLLATLDDVPQALWHAYAAARERDTQSGIENGGTFVETEYLRSVGFHYEPANATEYIEGYIAEVGCDRLTGATEAPLRVVEALRRTLARR